MPDIRAILKERGVADADAEAMIGNPSYRSILEGFVADAEGGKTALLKAQDIETNLKKWKDEVVDPHYLKKDQEYAQAQAKLAGQTTYLKSLKDQGYEVPDAWLTEAPANPNPSNPGAPVIPEGTYVKPDALDAQGRAYMSLMSMSERARDLLGHGLDIESEYDDFGKSKRPGEKLRDYIDRKYDLSTKQKEKDTAKAAADRKSIEDAAIEKYKAENPRSSNSDLAVPAVSRFDKFKTLPDDRKNSWQTETGREAATQARQQKYEKILIQ
jgi:hypothetical protein